MFSILAQNRRGSPLEPIWEPKLKTWSCQIMFYVIPQTNGTFGKIWKMLEIFWKVLKILGISENFGFFCGKFWIIIAKVGGKLWRWDQTSNLQNTTVQIWHKTLWIHCVLCLESGYLKRLRGTIKYCGGTTNSTTYLKSLSQWIWSCERLDLSVIMWIFFKLTLVSVSCSTIKIKKRL